MVAEVLGYEDPDQSLKVNCHEINKLSYLDIGKNMEPVTCTGSSKDGASKPIFNQLLDSGWKQTPLVTKRLWIPESDVYRLVMRS